MSAYERRFLSPAAGADPVSIHTRADGNTIISGYASVFFDPARPGTEYRLWDGAVERIRPGAFDRAIRDRHDCRALLNHDPNFLLGRVGNGTCRISADLIGLRYDIDLNVADPDHVRVLQKITRGDLNGSSFAFKATRVYWDDSGDPEIRWVEDVELYDVGPVTYPAYEATTTGLRTNDEMNVVRAERNKWIDAKNNDFDLRLRRMRLRMADLGHPLPRH